MQLLDKCRDAHRRTKVARRHGVHREARQFVGHADEPMQILVGRKHHAIARQCMHTEHVGSLFLRQEETRAEVVGEACAEGGIAHGPRPRLIPLHQRVREQRTL